jgi:hypothetical protein
MLYYDVWQKAGGSDSLKDSINQIGKNKVLVAEIIELMETLFDKIDFKEAGIDLPFCSYKKVAIFTTNVDAENQTLINHKWRCGALNRHFCQTRVSTSPFFSVVFARCHFVSILVRWLGGSFAVFCLALCGWKNCKCATKCISLC